MIASRSASCRASLSACSLLAGLLTIGSSGCGWMAHTDNIAGVGFFEQGNYAAATQKFQQGIEADPNDADSYYNLAATYHRQGKLANQKAQLDQAETYYHLCLDRNPDHRDCYRGLAVLLVEENRPDDAFSLLQRWGERSPSSPEPKVELARLFQEFGDKQAAQAHLQDALSIAPDNPRALAALGKLKEESGDPTQALAVYQRSLASNRFQPDVAARVATLQSAIPGAMPTAPDGTRLVTAPQSPLR
ncbi:MAG TPA: tetratricopeptide repeat protein [Pirellulales bacterium]|nr:tetratricopeptide repeat protein [Pirellulales bacterium]